MIKRKFKIIFEVDCQYPFIEMDNQKITKAFDQWIKDWSSSEVAGENIMPILYVKQQEHQANGTVKVKVTRDNETILDTSWDELSNDF